MPVIISKTFLLSYKEHLRMIPNISSNSSKCFVSLLKKKKPVFSNYCFSILFYLEMA